MSFNPDWAKEVQEVISLRKSDKSRLPPLYFNNATVKLNPCTKASLPSIR